MSGRLYGLDPRDTTGVFLGLSVAELTVAGGGVLLAILLHASGAPVMVSALVALAGAALAKLRVGGTPLHEWIRVLIAWTTARPLGRHRWEAPLPLFGATGVPAAELPPVLRGIDVVEIGERGRSWAAIRDRSRARLTAVVEVEGPQFAGLDPDAQDALLAAWGDALRAPSEAGGAVAQIGWSDTSVPADLSAHRAWAAQQYTPARSVASESDGYEDLVEAVESAAMVHHTVLWVTVDGTRVRGAHGAPAERAAEQLPMAVDDLLAALGAAGVHVGDPLGAPGLWRLLRSRIDPTDTAMRADGRPASLAERLGLVGAHNGAPVSMEATPSEVWIDGTAHRTFWVEAWPRRPVPGDWLGGFLACGEPRTITVAYRPIDAHRAQRRINSQMAKLTANRIRKQEKERRVTEVDLRTEEAVQELEAELASGHTENLYVGLVTASAATVEELDARCRHLEQAARATGMGLRALHRRHDISWAAALPFGFAEPGVLDLVGV